MLPTQPFANDLFLIPANTTLQATHTHPLSISISLLGLEVTPTVQGFFLGPAYPPCTQDFGRDWADWAEGAPAKNRASSQQQHCQPPIHAWFSTSALAIVLPLPLFFLCVHVQPPPRRRLGSVPMTPPPAKRGPRCETHLHFVVNATGGPRIRPKARPPCQPCQPMFGRSSSLSSESPFFWWPAYPIDYGPSYAGTGASRWSP